MGSTIIIGGGISGLTAAWALGRECTLIDDGASLGGVMQTRRMEGCLIEAGPDSFLAAKPAAMKLIGELGLADQVIGSNDHQRVTFIQRHGRLVPMPDGLMMMIPTKMMPMAFTPLLSWGTKIRMGLEFFRRPRTDAPDRSVADFVREHYGQEVVDYLAEPLLAGVYGGDPERLSVASVLPRMVELEKKYGSLTRGTLTERKKAPPAPKGATLFRTLRGGLGTLVEALEKAIAGRVRVVHGRAEALEAGYRVKVNGEWLAADEVIIATPAWAAAELVRPLDGALAADLAAIEYASSLTVGLVYDEKAAGKLEGFGFLVPKREREFLLATTFVHRKFDHRAEPGRALVRAFAADAALPDGEAIERTRADLKRLIGLTAEPLAVSIGRWPRSMAQYGVGHAGRVARIEERAKAIPGLKLIGNGYRGIGIPDCIQMARDAAPQRPS